MKKLLFVLFFVLLLALTACSATIQRSADTLVLTQQTIVSLASTIDAMCTAGALTQSQCDEAAHLYQESRVAYAHALEVEQLAIDAAIAGADADQNYPLAISAWTSVAAKFVTFAAKVGVIKE